MKIPITLLFQPDTIYGEVDIPEKLAEKIVGGEVVFVPGYVVCSKGERLKEISIIPKKLSLDKN